MNRDETGCDGIKQQAEQGLRERKNSTRSNKNKKKQKEEETKRKRNNLENQTEDQPETMLELLFRRSLRSGSDRDQS